MESNVGILAIGNEVVDGQITNRNASWLSEKLNQIGASPLYHLSCRDKDDEISAALEFLTKHCQLIITSGGLGPTKDDFTRQSLSKWLGKPLKIDNDLWDSIQQKLAGRKLTIRDGHKQQALIPEGAMALKNEVGVAPGFFSESPNGFLASLPGPPYELQAMFNDSLAPLIKQQMNPKKALKLETWICLGAPESEIAHIVESIIGEDIEIGYRLHKPYVEVKLWLPENTDESLKKRILLMEEKLKPWLVSRSIHEIREKFHKKIAPYDYVYVVDQLTSGLFLEKLNEGFQSDNLRYQCFENKAYRFFNESEVKSIMSAMGNEFGHNSLTIWLFPKTENSAFISYNDKLHSIEVPRSIKIKSKLGKLYVIENCFLELING